MGTAAARERAPPSNRRRSDLDRAVRRTTARPDDEGESTMTSRLWLLIAPLTLLLAFGGVSSVAGQGTPVAGSPSAGAPGTCLPPGGIPKKDSYLIGMSQANKGEPWRQAMNDQIAAAAAKHPELQVVFADAAQNNAKQVADVENFLQQGIDLLIISPN